MGLAGCEEQSQLSALGADITQTSVSGLSSGAYMAGQFHFAYSSLIIGAGIVAGGPYGCAESVFGRFTPAWAVALSQNLNRAINGCTGTVMAALGVPDVARLAKRVRERAEQSVIDPIHGLKSDRIYLFAGKSDRTVAPSLVRKAAQLYRDSGVKEQNIALETGLDAGHGFITEDSGGSCETTASPFVNDCDYDQAGAILKHIYGSLKSPSAENRGDMLIFSQAEFAKTSDHGLDDEGAIFIPESCSKEGDEANGACRVHIVFHGCRQSREAVGDAFIAGAGYNRWAASNQLIVLYPQISKSTVNPRGCWDWWGYTGPDFLTRDAHQIKAVKAMLERLAQTGGT